MYICDLKDPFSEIEDAVGVIQATSGIDHIFACFPYSYAYSRRELHWTNSDSEHGKLMHSYSIGTSLISMHIYVTTSMLTISHISKPPTIAVLVSMAIASSN